MKTCVVGYEEPYEMTSEAKTYNFVLNAEYLLLAFKRFDFSENSRIVLGRTPRAASSTRNNSLDSLTFRRT